MLLILIYFLFLLVMSSSIGMLTSDVLGISTNAGIDKIWYGFVAIAIIAGIWSFFAGLDFYFLIVLILLASFSSWKYRLKFWRFCIGFRLKRLSVFTKVCAALLLLILLANASLSGYVLDNDSYYIQTIVTPYA